MVLYVFAFTEAEGLIISIWDMVACICIICVAFLLFFDSRNSFGTRLLHLFWLVLGILCVTNFPWGTWLPTIIFVAHPSCRPTALLLTAACVLALRALTPFVRWSPSESSCRPPAALAWCSWRQSRMVRNPTSGEKEKITISFFFFFFLTNSSRTGVSSTRRCRLCPPGTAAEPRTLAQVQTQPAANHAPKRQSGLAVGREIVCQGHMGGTARPPALKASAACTCRWCSPTVTPRFKLWVKPVCWSMENPCTP